MKHNVYFNKTITLVIEVDTCCEESAKEKAKEIVDSMSKAEISSKIIEDDEWDSVHVSQV